MAFPLSLAEMQTTDETIEQLRDDVGHLKVCVTALAKIVIAEREGNDQDWKAGFAKLIEHLEALAH